MKYTVTVLHTSSGASFATHGPVREDARPSKFKATIEANDIKSAEQIAINLAQKSDYYYGRTLSVSINEV